jgi:hypothetical protein
MHSKFYSQHVQQLIAIIMGSCLPQKLPNQYLCCECIWIQGRTPRHISVLTYVYQAILQLLPSISSSCMLKPQLKLISVSSIFIYIKFLHGRPQLFRLPRLFAAYPYCLLHYTKIVQILTDVHNVLQDNIGSILRTHCPSF